MAPLLAAIGLSRVHSLKVIRETLVRVWSALGICYYYSIPPHSSSGFLDGFLRGFTAEMSRLASDFRTPTITS
jgi:hypothetical protein